MPVTGRQHQCETQVSHLPSNAIFEQFEKVDRKTTILCIWRMISFIYLRF